MEGIKKEVMKDGKLQKIIQDLLRKKQEFIVQRLHCDSPGVRVHPLLFDKIPCIPNRGHLEFYRTYKMVSSVLF